LRKVLQSAGIFLQKIGSFRLLARMPLISVLKMLITTTTTVTLPVFAVSFAISSAFVASLRAVLTTLIGQAYVTYR
jgi:hypothetical protein